MVCCLAQLRNVDQQSQNLGFAQIQILLLKCGRFAIVTIFGNSSGLKRFRRSTILQKQFAIINPLNSSLKSLI